MLLIWVAVWIVKKRGDDRYPFFLSRNTYYILQKLLK